MASFQALSVDVFRWRSRDRLLVRTLNALTARYKAEGLDFFMIDVTLQGDTRWTPVSFWCYKESLSNKNFSSLTMFDSSTLGSSSNIFHFSINLRKQSTVGMIGWNASKALPRTGLCWVNSMVLLRSFLRCHFAGKPVVTSRNVSCFFWLLFYMFSSQKCSCGLFSAIVGLYVVQIIYSWVPTFIPFSKPLLYYSIQTFCLPSKLKIVCD